MRNLRGFPYRSYRVGVRRRGWMADVEGQGKVNPSQLRTGAIAFVSSLLPAQ